MQKGLCLQHYFIFFFINQIKKIKRENNFSLRMIGMGSMIFPGHRDEYLKWQADWASVRTFTELV
jgi:hypothetical protein